VRVVVVSGIWPPDPGGPASHAPAFAEFLTKRGHGVEAVTTAAGAPAARPYPVSWAARRSPLRHLRAALLVRRAARRADVVDATSMIRRAAIGSRLARRPLVAKLVSDEVFEREARSGRYAGTLDEFQRISGGARIRLLRATRNAALRRARHVFCPSRYLRDIALGWGLDPTRVSVLPNPAPEVPSMPSRDELRVELGIEGNTLAFAGRLGRQKALGVALTALEDVSDVSLVVAGDGPERAALETRAAELGLGARARFLGSVPRDTVLRLFRAADATVLPSAWENFPHTVVESLAVGCPVIATAVGGVPEAVRDGENGLLVEPGDAAALARAISRLFSDAELRARLSAAAPASVDGYSEEAVFTTVEAELVRAASP
jgi:glycosyltransferase involved in cell wall biosynthesis